MQKSRVFGVLFTLLLAATAQARPAWPPSSAGGPALDPFFNPRLRPAPVDSRAVGSDDYEMDACEGYEVICSEEGTPCRVDARQWPLRLYSRDPYYNELTWHAAEVWNKASRRWMGRDLFEVHAVSVPTAVPIEWNSRRLPRGAAGVTTLRKMSDRVMVTGVALGPNRRPPGNVAEVLAHELGHVLGLDHSEDPRDLMYRSTHEHWLESPTQVRLTQRDLGMFRWLYAQPGTIPIIALDRGRGRLAER